MANMNDQPMTKEKRQEKIIDIIRSNKYCNKQTVVNELKDAISRATVFDLLRELIKIGAVKTYSENNQKKNARDYKLFVAEDNPLVSVRLELEKFESAYFSLFDKVSVEIEPKHIDTKLKAIAKEAADDASELRKLGKKTNEIFEHVRKSVEHTYELGYRYGRLSRLLWEIFYSMIDACLFRFLFIWSQKISDQRILQQFYSMVFSKIADMQTRLSKSLKGPSQSKDINNDMERFILERFRGSKGSRLPILYYLDSSKELGIEKEIEPVIDALWKIIGDLQPYVYPEPRTYGWPFKYGEDDWRKLVNLLRKHRKSIPHSTDKG
jgi:hypothetical protein